MSRTFREPSLPPSRRPQIRFNEAFNVGQTAHNYRIRDLAEIVKDVVPGCTVEFAEDAGPDKRSYRVNFEKIGRKLPAFKPQWDAFTGAEQFYKAYREIGLTLAEFEGPRYQRIGHIKMLLANQYPRQQLRHTQPPRDSTDVSLFATSSSPATERDVSLSHCVELWSSQRNLSEQLVTEI